MVISGHIENGVVVLDGGISLPEGAQVSIIFPVAMSYSADRPRKRVELPLVDSKNPGSIKLSAERIAEILDEEDAST